MRIQKPADLARAVKTQRQALGYTQQQVADASGITRQSLARIEQGNGGVAVNTLLRIFARLEIEFEAIRVDRNSGLESSRDVGGREAGNHSEDESREKQNAAPEIEASPVAEKRESGIQAVNQGLRTFATIIAQANLGDVQIGAARAAIRGLGTTSLVSTKFDSLSALASAATSARSIGGLSETPQWRSAQEKLVRQVQREAAGAGREITAGAAQRALLQAAIDEGDPDPQGKKANEISSEDSQKGLDESD